MAKPPVGGYVPNINGSYTIPVGEDAGNFIEMLKGISFNGQPALGGTLGGNPYNTDTHTLTISPQAAAFLQQKHGINVFAPFNAQPTPTQSAPLLKIPSIAPVLTTPPVPTVGIANGGNIGQQGNGILEEGGIQSGKGTAKSDSNPVKLPQGTIIIPVKNADKAVKIRRRLDMPTGKFNNKDNSADPKIWTSKGEVIFTQEEAEIAKQKGYNLDELIEGDGQGTHLVDGGEVNNLESILGKPANPPKSSNPPNIDKELLDVLGEPEGKKKVDSESTTTSSKESESGTQSQASEVPFISPKPFVYSFEKEAAKQQF